MLIAHAARRSALALAAVATCATTAMGQQRTWTDGTGKFSVEAELVDTQKENVVLKKANGSTITVPIARLSDADREYLKKLPKPDAKTSDRVVARPQLAFPDAITEPPSWNDANTPFDMAAFLKAPPLEENAAPLYLDALLAFSWNEMNSLGPKQSEAELRAHSLHSQQLYQAEQKLDAAWEKDPKSVDAKALDAWLANFDVGFEKLAAAQQRPKCVFQPGHNFHSLLPHNQTSRQVAKVVAWRTRRDLERGDLERPLQDLKTLLRLNRDLQVRGGIVAQLVAIALDEQSCELVRTILNARGLNTRQCDQLLALLADHEAKSIDPFVDGTRSEYITSRQALHDLQHRTGSFDPQTLKKAWGFTGDVNSPLAFIRIFTEGLGRKPQQFATQQARLQGALLPGAWQGGKLLSDDDYAKEVAALNRFFATILALAGQPNFLRTGEAAVKAAEAPIRETTLATFIFPPTGPLIGAMCRNEARLRGTQCLVALRRWQLEHPEAPSELATLVKAANMPSVPIDPFSDQPLHLGTVAGRPVIYSVGPDGKDDQAQVEWSLYPNQPGDFIFRLESTPK